MVVRESFTLWSKVTSERTATSWPYLRSKSRGSPASLVTKDGAPRVPSYFIVKTMRWLGGEAFSLDMPAQLGLAAVGGRKAKQRCPPCGCSYGRWSVFFFFAFRPQSARLCTVLDRSKWFIRVQPPPRKAHCRALRKGLPW